MEHLAADLEPLAEAAVVAGFMLLMVIALVRAPRLGAAAWWMAGAFGALATALSMTWIFAWFGRDGGSTRGALQFVLVLAFPYLLLRFTATFRPVARGLELAAAAAALAAAVAAIAVVAAPDGSAATSVWLIVILVYWAAVSLVSVTLLWRAGGGQPGVARRRMRLMALAAAVLTVALVLAIELGGVGPVGQLTAYLCALVSATAFGLGFAPPRALRLAWRWREDNELQSATRELLRADTVEQVAASLLPPTVSIVGGRGAALVDDDGRVIASHGAAPPAGTFLDDLSVPAHADAELVPLGDGHGQLVVWTSAYTPFFGPEELGLLASMAAIAALALERCTLLSDERAQKGALERAQQQSEIARVAAETARADADAANLAKSEFLSRMSHELRTPLNAILGFGQLFDVAALNADDREGVEHILKAGQHLLALIDDVLDLSRIETGMFPISLEPVHAGELLEYTLPLIQPLAASRSIRIITAATGCDDHVLTDRQRVRQVLLNLLSNAVKYNRDDGEVHVRCERVADDSLRISVRDTGPGIDPARQARLFQPFDRLGAEDTDVEGTGLGLALTKHLVERLGGSVGFRSAPREGSTFWVDLPLTAAPAEVTAAEPTFDAAVPTGAYRLLLVEDNLVNLRVVEAMLRRRPGITVLPAMQGSIALEFAYDHRPDVIVLDLHLPDMTGREVLHRLKADPRTRDIPVIVASADASPQRARQLQEDGAFAYVTKPLDLTGFLAVVDTALARRPDVVANA